MVERSLDGGQNINLGIKRNFDRVITTLLIEDNLGDIRLTQEALKESKMKISLHVVRDGVEGYNYLKKREQYYNTESPDLVILDLNLPKKDGRELLSDIKKDPILKLIPIVVLTTSTEEKDILQMYGLHANCYIPKPLDFDQFSEIVKTISNFWFTIVKLPKLAN